jgi:hypothetical protein
MVACLLQSSRRIAGTPDALMPVQNHNGVRRRSALEMAFSANTTFTILCKSDSVVVNNLRQITFQFKG